MDPQQSQPIESVIGDHDAFLEKVFGNLEKAGFDLGEFKEIDHIAYRTENLEQYEKVKKDLLGFSKSYDEAMFGSRLILVSRLETPLAYGNFAIQGIELLAPKEGNTHKEGLEHAEFVIKTTLPQFREKHADIEFDLRAYGRKDNPELIVDFENCAAKLHTQSLLGIRGI